jgi:polyferredoxin
VIGVVTPTEGLDSGLYGPLYLVLILYVALFMAGRVLEGRDDARAEPVQDAGFALLLLAAVYVFVLAVMAFASEIDLLVDLLQIMAIVIGFFAVLVLVLLAIELLFGVLGRSRRTPVAPTDDQ